MLDQLVFSLEMYEKKSIDIFKMIKKKLEQFMI